jgi:hypothetical protein
MAYDFVFDKVGNTNPNIMLEFLNIFVIKGKNLYFECKDKLYVISKQLIVDVFKVYA